MKKLFFIIFLSLFACHVSAQNGDRGLNRTHPNDNMFNQTRKAIVIGMSNYVHEPYLDNTLNDANDMYNVLTQLGFDVTLLTDKNLQTLEDGLNKWYRSIEGSKMVVFFYSGHGIQVKGQNYLIPIDFPDDACESDVKYKALNVNEVVERLNEMQVDMKLLILDACRNNPLKGNCGGRGIEQKGFAGMEVPIGTYFVYSTAPGTEALDGKADYNLQNGVFTHFFKQEILKPGASINDIVNATTLDVSNLTGRQQVPYQGGTLAGNYYFSLPGNNPEHNPVYNPQPVPNNLSSTAYLNNMDVITAMPEYKQMQASLKSSQDEFQAELKSMSDEYSKKLSDYVNQQNSLDENTKVRKQQELQDLQQRAENFQQSAAKQQDEMLQRLSVPIQDKLQKAINDVGKENNFLYITNYTACRYVSPTATNATPLVKRKLGIPTSPDNNPVSVPDNLSPTAYLNYMDVITAMPEYKQMQASLKSSQDQFQSELKNISDEYTKKLSNYVAQQDSLNESIKARRKQELQDLQQRAQNFHQSAAQQQDTMQQRLAVPIQDKLQKVINDVGYENNFLFIFDSQIFLYISSSATDATPLVKRKLGTLTSLDNNLGTVSNNLSPTAYLNYMDIITAMPEYKQMQASLKSSQDEFQSQLKSLSDEYTKKLSDYMNQQNLLNESIKVRRQQELQDLRQRAQSFQQSAAQQQDEMQQRLSAPIQDKLQKAISDVGKENNFLYIVNSQTYLYVSPSASDATSLVKRKLGIQ